MNETRVYADGFTKAFAGENDFLSFLKNRQGQTEWRKEQSNQLRFEALLQDSEQTDELVDAYRELDKEEVITDTLGGTQLILRTEDSCIPVRNCAIQTILERARISGNALSKVDRQVFAKILNYCLKVADGQALLKVSDDKVSAIHGGDKSEYSILDMYELFAKTSDYLTANFSDVQYAGGFFEHSMVTALWTLNGNSELLETYKNLLNMHGVTCREMTASVRLTSSDTGVNGANLYPTLLADGKNIPIGSPLKLKHKHGASMKDFENKLVSKLIELHEKYPASGLNSLHHIITNDGIPCSRNLLHRLMKKYNIHSLRKRAYKTTTNSKHGYAVSPNLLKRDCSASEPDTKWVGDIT